MNQNLNGIEVYLAIKTTNINKGPIFRRIKTNHQDKYLHHLHVQTTSSTEIFKNLDGPAKFVEKKSTNGAFVYFMAHEITNEQFDEMVKTKCPFAIIQIDKEVGYITTCYNRIETSTNNTTTNIESSIVGART